MSSHRSGYDEEMPTITTGTIIEQDVESQPRQLAILTRPAEPTPYRWTAIDHAIVLALSRVRLATPDDLARIIRAVSVRLVRDRCRFLFRDGTITRPRTQRPYLELHHFHGAAPLIYALGRKGAAYLRSQGISLQHRIDESFRDPAPSQIPHFLATTKFIVDISEAAARSGIELADQADLLPLMPETTQRSRRPFHLTATVRENGIEERLTVRPDRVLALELPDQNTRLPLLVEIDKGTESLVGKITHKLTTYRHAFLQKRHTEWWGFQRFRVLFITTSTVRVAGMIDLQHHAITKGHMASSFLYTEAKRYAAQGPLGPTCWISAELPAVAKELKVQSQRLAEKPKLLRNAKDRRARVKR